MPGKRAINHSRAALLQSFGAFRVQMPKTLGYTSSGNQNPVPLSYNLSFQLLSIITRVASALTMFICVPRSTLDFGQILPYECKRRSAATQKGSALASMSTPYVAGPIIAESGLDVSKHMNRSRKSKFSFTIRAVSHMGQRSSI